MLCHVMTGATTSTVEVNGTIVATNNDYNYTLAGDVDVAISGLFDFSTYVSQTIMTITTK
mgnify:FL=1